MRKPMTSCCSFQKGCGVRLSGRRCLVVMIIVATILMATTTAAATTTRTPARRHLTTTTSNVTYEDNSQTTLPGAYIVVLQEDVTPVRSLLSSWLSSWLQAHSLKVKFVYQNALRGFVVLGLTPALLQRLQNHGRVRYLLPDTPLQLDFPRLAPSTTSVGVTTSATSSGIDQSTPPNWGLDRIDQAALPLNSKYHYDSTGAGVEAYVVDTGLRVTHVEFQFPTNTTSRARCGASFIVDETCDDFLGHGTHVAGIVGGKNFGVAKQVTVIAVKVFDKRGVGTVSTILAGLDYVVGQKKSRPAQAMVCNLSAAVGQLVAPLNDAISNTVAAGIVVALAAGNGNADACQYSPASTKEPLTVGATNITDYRADYSNWGTCIDLFAPGDSILSCGIASDTASATLSGTSMASPHVAGVAALLAQQRPYWNATQIMALLVNQTALQKLRMNLGTGSPNRLLQIPIKPLPTPAPSARPSRAPSHRPVRHPSRKPSRRPSSRPSRNPVAKPKTPRPATAACSIKNKNGTTTAGYWLHSKNKKGQCTSTCIASSKVPAYLLLGYQCGKC